MKNLVNNNFKDFLKKYFEKLRFHKDYHLGMGDIRLTLSMQEKICDLAESFSKEKWTPIEEKLSELLKTVWLTNEKTKNLTMRYRLINTETKREDFCDKVTVNGYDYYYKNEIPKIGDTVYNCESKEVYKVNKQVIVSYEFPIVATNNPSIDLPQIVDKEGCLRYFTRKNFSK